MTDEPNASTPASAPENDALPEDLDVTQFVGLTQFPDVRRRRIAAALLSIASAGSLVGGVASGNGGLIAAAIVTGGLAAYHLIASWPLAVDQTEALAVASRAVGFPVGHSSARVMFRGLRSKPVWQVLLYSADEPPSIRGLVELDAVDGSVLGEYTEHNPEDWSKYGLSSS